MVVIAACGAVSGGLARAGGVSTSSAPPTFPVRFWRGAAVASRRRGCRGVSVLRSRAMELVEDKDVNERCVLVGRRRREVLASSMEAVDKEAQQSQSLLNVRSGEELLSYIRKETETGKLPLNLAAGMEELYYNYRNAVRQSGIPLAEEIILSNMAITLDRILLDTEDPFIFPHHHKAAREPFDYYMFGQNYIRPLINFRRSYVGNISLFHEAEEKLRQGHNVILISNHQTEADPAIIALLLETTNPYIAEETIYIAGDRVVTDPLCKPFSMGRNLLCVYSKKHLYDIPEQADMKKMANTRSLKELAKLLRSGGQIIWIAPSGGRDRPDPVTGEWYPAPFDVSAVDNMRRLAEHSGIPGHIYPLSLHCHDVMPPPPRVEKEIGERRKICFHGVGMSLGPEVSYEKNSAGFKKPEEAAAAFSKALYSSVTEHYNALRTAIYGHNGSNDSSSSVSLSQPWD